MNSHRAIANKLLLRMRSRSNALINYGRNSSGSVDRYEAILVLIRGLLGLLGLMDTPDSLWLGLGALATLLV